MAAGQELLSYGNKHTKLKDAKLPEDFPFWGGSDNKEHDCKGFFRGACGSELFVNGEEIRLGRIIADLRGLVPVPDSDDISPSASGGYSYSKYNGASLEEILADCDAYTPESWHREFCLICTQKMIDLIRIRWQQSSPLSVLRSSARFFALSAPRPRRRIVIRWP